MSKIIPKSMISCSPYVFIYVKTKGFVADVFICFEITRHLLKNIHSCHHGEFG
jgi:hypothetical protein